VNIGEASDVQRLLGWLLDPHLTGPEDAEVAKAAAERLADRAGKTLGAGIRGDGVASSWGNLLEGCPGCEECQP
jgi:hypothetical protein